MRWLTVAALFGLLSYSGCKLTQIHVDQESTTTVPKGTVVEALLGNMGFGDFVAMDLTQDQALQNQGVAPGDIQDVRLDYLQLEATSPAGADLSFLHALSVYVEAPGVTRELLASADSFPVGAPLVDLAVEDLDLTPYVVSQNMTLTTEVNGQRPDQDTNVTARFRVVVGVTSQGACNAANAGN